MAYIDTKYLGKCETCRHFRSGGCNTYCDHGEEYSPDLSKIPTADVAPKSEVAREIFAEIIEGLEEEKRREEQCRNSALESGDLVVAELYDYAADKLDTIITALNLCKKKYTEEKEL